MRSISFSLFGIGESGTTRPGNITYGIQRQSNGQYRSDLSQNGGGGATTLWTLDPLPYYELEWYRQSDEMVITLNGMEMNRRPYIQADFNQVRINISGLIGTTTVGSRVDYVEVVPEPLAVVGLGAAAARVMLRKRQKRG
jgi:hypothetical protein